jgi:hypothetical protein
LFWQSADHFHRPCAGNLLAYGKTAYNRNDIDVVQLNEGQYVLEVYEPSLLNNANARGCVKFDLLVYQRSNPAPSLRASWLLTLIRVWYSVVLGRFAACDTVR